MRTDIYCSDISNVQRLVNGVTRLEARGAAEASWMLVHGKVGLGKTRALQWFSMQKDAVRVTAKPAWSVAWMLRDMCQALELQPTGSASQMSEQIFLECTMRQPILIIDEIGEIALKGELIGTLRSITDSSKVCVVAAGDEKALHKLKSNAPLFSRISEFAQFSNATENDVKILCDTLAEVQIDDALIKHIYNETAGNFREIMNAIARIEQAAGRNKGQIMTMNVAGNIRCKNYVRKSSSGRVA